MCEIQTKPPPSLLRHIILKELKEPVVFRGLIHWDLLSWSLRDWAKRLGKKVLPFRSGVKKATENPQWERNCHVANLTMNQFVELDEGNSNGAGPSRSTVTDNWFYFDYKYMHEWFQDNPEIIKSVSWAPLGFPEKAGAESSVWIGSDGAHTPCHMDTYGCNLVAQVHGTKQWIMFPPEKSAQMLPTRVPYEESSIYSKHNFYCANVKRELEGARVVTLNPGEVLFVPHHWWHYVENVGTAISINTWLSLPCDNEGRLEEALVKLLVSQVCKEVPEPELILNPNEDDVVNCPLSYSVMLVEACVEKFHRHIEGHKGKCPLNAKKSAPKRSSITKRCEMDSDHECSASGKNIETNLTKYRDVVATVPPKCSSTTKRCKMDSDHECSASGKNIETNLTKYRDVVATVPPKCSSTTKSCKMDSDHECSASGKNIETNLTKYRDVVATVPQCSVLEFNNLLSAKQEQFRSEKVDTRNIMPHTDTMIDRLLNAFCHPEVISKVKDILYEECQMRCDNAS